MAVPEGLPDCCEAFLAFTGQRDEMDGRQWVKVCEYAQLLDEQYLPRMAADLVFTKMKTRNARKIDYGEFEACLVEVAARKGMRVRDVMNEVRRAAQAPTERPRARTGGPERFFYDRSTYTGVHTRGGPSTVDTGRGGLIHDILHLCDRSRADSRGVKEYDSDAGRVQTSYIDPDHAGVATSGKGPKVPPIGKRVGSGMETPMTPRRERPAALAYTPEPVARERTMSGGATSPRSSGLALSPRSRASQLSQQRALLFKPQPRTSVKDGAPPRGPERFFYDKSTYTGVQANASVSSAGRPRVDLTDVASWPPKLPRQHPANRANAPPAETVLQANALPRAMVA